MPILLESEKEMPMGQMVEEVAPAQEEALPGKLALHLDQHFEELVLIYQDRIYAFALRLAGNVQDAEEIAQDAFVRAYRALTTYGQEQIRTLALRPWLYQIALNVFRNRVRKKRHASVPLEEVVSVDPALEPTDDERERPEAKVEENETREMVRNVVAALPDRYRAAVILRHIEGLGYTEMATILRQPAGTIKSNVHRGIEILRKALAQQMNERR
jgi:RNA polymerase sigma-70 factor (ECF subfamily)